jgi:3,4-dehydroadipyl-CoA semialdehyde dehydrogenase
MTERLPNLVAGRWQQGVGAGTPLLDPVLGTELVQVDATGLDLPAAFAFARKVGGAALRALTYGQRASLLAQLVTVLQSHRADYEALSQSNSGTVKADTAVDVDGAIFTLSQYARWGAALGDRRFLLDGDVTRLSKEPHFCSQHVQVPTQGLALLINAFNFPAWGLWEKAAPALLSGVPVVVKPATATAWLTQRMVHDVVAAGILPPGALSIVCGSSDGLLDALEPFDVLSFTGSAATAGLIRRHPAVTTHSVRTNVEADSLNSALLMPGEPPGSDAFELLVREVVREMTVKSGQKCTAIRRVLVPEALYGPVAEAVSARLSTVTVGNPRNGSVRMGSLVSRAQKTAVREGLAALKTQTEVLHDGTHHTLVDADPEVSCCVGPTLLGTRHADTAALVHELEVFGPVCTLVAVRDLSHALELARRAQGSLVASVYGADPAALASAALDLSASHGRVHVVSPDVGRTHTGHGNVMPHSLHGGPGRAGGGEELGGLRALNFYHRRAAVQAGTDVLAALG